MLRLTTCFLPLSLLFIAAVLAGCGSTEPERSAVSETPTTGEHSDHSDDSERRANFAQLSEEDRALAAAQGYCAVTSEPLGSMGPPIKLIVNEQPVFICCEGCKEKAQSNPTLTIAKVEELKVKVQSESGR